MLEQHFYYDNTSPSCLRWNETRYTGNPKRVLVSKGDYVGNKTPRGYYETSVNGKKYLTHRIVWELFNGGILEGMTIDHIDGNPSNNKIENLRLATKMENARNSKKRSHNKTGHTGVAKTLKVENGKEYWYYTALWKTLDGAQRTANYSINKLGDSSAFLLAFTHRQGAMEDLDGEGAGYTKRHGK